VAYKVVEYEDEPDTGNVEEENKPDLEEEELDESFF
jgi:hypothetical protein